MSNPSLLILPGDGIGAEVMVEVRRIIDWFGAKRDLAFDVSEDLVGGAAYDKHGVPLHDDTMAKAQEVDAVLLGAVGGPKYDNLDFSVKPERGLLRLRKEMDLFANLRPAQCFDALADFSSLKTDIVAGLDIMIVRELTSGVYFGEPRGIHMEDNMRVGVNTQRYTEAEIERGARAAFELAMKRGKKLCSMETVCCRPRPSAHRWPMVARRRCTSLYMVPHRTSWAKVRRTRLPASCRLRWPCATRLTKALRLRASNLQSKKFWLTVYALAICSAMRRRQPSAHRV